MGDRRLNCHRPRANEASAKALGSGMAVTSTWPITTKPPPSGTFPNVRRNCIGWLLSVHSVLGTFGTAIMSNRPKAPADAVNVMASKFLPGVCGTSTPPENGKLKSKKNRPLLEFVVAIPKLAPAMEKRGRSSLFIELRPLFFPWLHSHTKIISSYASRSESNHD